MRFANALKKLGVGKGTPVAIYMGMVPELPVAMLACTRLGAPHTVVFGGFSADSLSGRMVDMGCEVLITQDEAWRRGSTVPLKRTADEAMSDAPKVRASVVLRRTGNDVPMQDGRDHWWHELEDGVPDDAASCPCEPMDERGSALPHVHERHDREAEGHRAHDRAATCAASRRRTTTSSTSSPRPTSTGAPPTSAGSPGTATSSTARSATARRRCSTRGRPTSRTRSAGGTIVERYGVTILYTAPTAIRAHMKWGPEYAQQHDLSSLRLLGSVGEPINPEAWIWYREHIGGDRTPIVDTWWQTETGMVLITPLPGVTTTKPGSATKPFPGVDAGVFDERGNEVGPGGGGYLVLKRPWPAMLRGIFGDDARYRETYWSKYENVYFAGDGARIDQDGDFWLLGRVDDVMNVSGHRISTIEVESALVDHHDVAEAAVCSRKDATTGEAIVAYVTLKGSADAVGREARRAARPRREEDRRDREAGEHRLHARAAEDAQRQDHAPPAARRRREPAARRHDDARRPDRRLGDPEPRRATSPRTTPDSTAATGVDVILVAGTGQA